ncbi:MAG: Gp138 family membrane-puncturing spike protein [Burkholderia gladioli]
MNQLGYQGFQEPGDAVGQFGALSFLVNRILSRVHTITLVEVVAVTNSGDLSPVGFVDVQPLVNQIDGAGNAMPHGVIHHVPYFRLQGGTNAVVIDPQIGDKGLCAFASRDISSVKATKARANPGSRRVFDMADGLYIGGFLNGDVVQVVQFSRAGIDIRSPTKITLHAPSVEINANTSFSVNSPQSTFSAAVTINGLLTFVGGMIGSATKGAAAVFNGVLNVIGQIAANGKRVDDTHTHGGVQPGGGNTGAPN